jgi:hypothetical protein
MNDYYVYCRRNIFHMFVSMFEVRDAYEYAYIEHSWLYRQKREDFWEIYDVLTGQNSIQA